MADFTVSTQQLRQVADELVGLLGQYQQQLGRLIENESELDAMWDGPANQTFKAAFGKSYESLNSFYTVVAEYVESLNYAATIYEQNEQRAAELAKL